MSCCGGTFGTCVLVIRFRVLGGYGVCGYGVMALAQCVLT